MIDGDRKSRASHVLNSISEQLWRTLDVHEGRLGSEHRGSKEHMRILECHLISRKKVYGVCHREQRRLSDCE
jgi:hypothetical protein